MGPGRAREMGLLRARGGVEVHWGRGPPTGQQPTEFIPRYNPHTTPESWPRTTFASSSLKKVLEAEYPCDVKYTEIGGRGLACLGLAGVIWGSIFLGQDVRGEG